MKSVYLSIIVICAAAGTCFAQEESDSNRVDENGLKQGYWINRYADGVVMYQGYFITDCLARLMKRYHKNCNSKLTFIFFSNN